MQHLEAGVVALFLLRLDGRFRGTGVAAFGDEGGELRVVLRQRVRQRMIRRQRTVWREWCARPQTTDQEFLRGCGLPGEDPLSRKLALATRYALAEAR